MNAPDRAAAAPSAGGPAPQLNPAEQAVVDAVLAERRHLAGALLPILHGIQDRLGYVPPGAQPVIARALHLSRAEVHGVVTFYHHFRSEPAGRHVLQVCRAEACQACGGEALLARSRERLGCSEAAPTNAARSHTVEPTYCLGLCAQSPAAMLDGRLHARLTPQRLDALLATTEPAAESVGASA